MKNIDFKKRLKCSILDTSAFRKTYLITLSFEMIAFLNIISLMVKCITLSWGLFILIHNFFIEKRAFNIDHKYLIWSFLTSMTLTSLVNISIWLVPNLVLVYYTAVCFLMFYGMYMEQDVAKTEKEMIFIFKFWVVFGTTCALASLLLLFFKNEINVFGYNLGIFRNRLIGIYTNSNILAFSMIQSIVACDFLASSYISSHCKDSKFPLWFLILCVGINCTCLFLSDSNASFLFLIIYCAIRVFCGMFFKNKEFKGTQLFRSMIILMGFCLVMASVCFALRNLCQRYISVAVNDIHRQEKILKNKSVESKEIIDQDTPIDSLIIPRDDDDPDMSIGRANYEVSSGRIALFKQGIEMFKHHPIIGIGRANLLLYSKKYFKNGLVHSDLHNGYLTILVCYGILGFSIFAIFSLVVALDVCKHLFKSTNKSYFSTFIRLFSALVAYCGYCLFEKAILFDMTFMVGFFWLILGYAVVYTKTAHVKTND